MGQFAEVKPGREEALCFQAVAEVRQFRNCSIVSRTVDSSALSLRGNRHLLDSIFLFNPLKMACELMRRAEKLVPKSQWTPVSAGLASLSLIVMISVSSRRSARPAGGGALRTAGFHLARLCGGAVSSWMMVAMRLPAEGCVKMPRIIEQGMVTSSIHMWSCHPSLFGLTSQTGFSSPLRAAPQKVGEAGKIGQTFVH